MLDIKPSHKPIKNYYAALAIYSKNGVTKETSVRGAFADLLSFYAKKLKWTLTEEYTITLANKNKGSVDGALTDAMTTPMGFWEAKDTQDDLKKEIKAKFEKGYPKSNILFQQPDLAVLYQDGILVDTYDLTQPERLVACLETFFGYKADEQADWEELVAQFKQRIPESAEKLISMIEEEKKTNTRFKEAFKTFAELCRASINPNLADPAIEEMLVQHLLTSRIFSSVFDNAEFLRRNVIAAEIETVIDALTSQSFNRHQFFAPLDHFYVALENRAKSITDWSQKQHFLNTVYEKFFQGFAVKVADTHGIVYTPQPIVDFMVRSVEHILKTEFDRSLSDKNVHILDPFVGTGNFIMRIMREIKRTALPHKYKNELHCNEVMLLPYYIASMNIEHEYYSEVGKYEAFEGICLVDTFELAEPDQGALFSTENTERVKRQKQSPIFVIVGNPPYNAGQVNENDNNKNRKYPVIDKRVSESYSKESRATNKIALSDPYVKAFRFASDRVIANGEGVISFVSNSSFLEDVAFDGMRKQLSEEFDEIFIFNLGGNVRKNPKLSGTTHNVFGIQVGVSINILVRRKSHKKGTTASIYYSRTDEFARKSEKYSALSTAVDVTGIDWQRLEPSAKGNWLTAGMIEGFDSLLAMGTKEGKAAGGSGTIFKIYSSGIKTNRDQWIYNFDEGALLKNVTTLTDEFNRHLIKLANAGKRLELDPTTDYDDRKIAWSEGLKNKLRKGKQLIVDDENVRVVLQRPFERQFVYFEKALIERTYQFTRILPTPESEKENLVISLHGIGMSSPFSALATNILPDVQLTPNSQCFAFYTYNEDGTNRKENITDWALEQFKTKLKTKKEVTKWDIFYYIYGILHHPEYRTKYAANLRRELPRVPISPDFFRISELGKHLADLHVNYESAKEFDLEEEWRKGSVLNLRVEKMKLTKDKASLIYNADLTLRGIPPEVFDYKLGNRSALEWVIDQYQVSTDKRSGITNDPNREDDEGYILRLIKQVITVSLETVKAVKEIAGLRME
ncbi:MAG: N-6 DNA methylase [Bacteroidetes bacterium]|nr:N-6 DNA methylase [Bacteroidota bacterium]